jgi:nicotinamide/nicotinate riboside kinase
MIIGIGGVSRSGKTTLALEMKASYEAKGHRVVVLHQDDFVQPEDKIPLIHDRIDWECPASMDFERLHAAITEAAQRADYVIAEGILVFYDPKVNALFDERILLEIDRDTFLERRALETRWGVEPLWFREYVWESYLKYGKIGYAS